MTPPPLYRDWCWQLLAQGYGPDVFFFADFRPAAARRLAELVQQHLPDTYRRDDVTPASTTDCRQSAHYIDLHTYTRLAASPAAPPAIHYYGAIDLCDHTLTIRNVLNPGAYGETRLLLALAQAADLDWQGWKIAYGGDGYAGQDIAQGADAAALIAYLTHSA